MRFLCLHGRGTNNQIFETQTAALRYELGDHHTFEFVEGVLPWPMDPEVGSYFSTDYGCFTYYDRRSAQSAQKALDELEEYVEVEGPFDGIMAFSQGACLAAMLMARRAQWNPTLPYPKNSIFKCAILFSGFFVEDPTALARKELQYLNSVKDSQLIQVPTAIIWGSNDMVISKEIGHEFSKLFSAKHRIEFIHEEGHGVPKAKTAVVHAVNAIRRVVGMAM